MGYDVETRRPTVIKNPKRYVLYIIATADFYRIQGEQNITWYNNILFLIKFDKENKA